MTSYPSQVMRRFPIALVGLLLLALADRDDPTVLPAVLKAATSGSKEVQVAAIGVLQRVGKIGRAHV